MTRLSGKEREQRREEKALASHYLIPSRTPLSIRRRRTPSPPTTPPPPILNLIYQPSCSSYCNTIEQQTAGWLVTTPLPHTTSVISRTWAHPAGQQPPHNCGLTLSPHNCEVVADLIGLEGPSHSMRQ